MVREVEELRSEVEVFAFRHIELLAHAEIPVGIAWGANDAYTRAAERAAARIGSLKCGDVEPVIERLIVRLGVTNQIGTLSSATVLQGEIISRRDRDREPSVRADNAA